MFTFGLGKKAEVGITIYQLTFNTRPNTRVFNVTYEKPGQNIHLLVNAQKGFELKKWLKIGIGTRSGVNPSRNLEVMDFATFSYFNSQFSIPDSDNKFIMGTFYTNRSFSGGGTRSGIMLGAQIVVLKDKMTLIGDFISGTNSLSNNNLGFQISLPHKWQIALAAQLHAPVSDNNHGGIIQIARK